MQKLTAQFIRNAMAGAPLKTRQPRVCIPIIERYIKMLQEGSAAPNIKVAAGVIVEGNHRYIAGYIHGKPPAMDPYIMPSNSTILTWDQVEYDEVDWARGKS